jgi:hypothetical protein
MIVWVLWYVAWLLAFIFQSPWHEVARWTDGQRRYEYAYRPGYDWSRQTERRPWTTRFWRSLYRSLPIWVVLVGAAYFATFIVDPYKNGDHAHGRVDQLVSLGRGNGTTGTIGGSFLFVYGTFDTDLVYSYYVQLGDGAYQGRQLSTTNNNNRRPLPIVVYEEERSDATLEVLWYYRDVTWWARDVFGIGTDWRAVRYEFHVPKGTIVREFRL